MTTDHLRELSNDLVVATARLTRLVRRNSDRVPIASVRLLSLLDETGPATVSRLAAADRCSQPTMTGLVNGLTERGWLQRAPHPRDARSSLVALTPAGRAQLSAVRRRNADLVAARVLASGHTTEQLAAAVALVTDVVGDPMEETTTC